MAHPLSQTYGKQRCELLQLLHDEAQLQRQLKEHCGLLQRVSEASVSLLVWWRKSAVQAAEAAQTSKDAPVPSFTTDAEAAAEPDDACFHNQQHRQDDGEGERTGQSWVNAGLHRGQQHPLRSFPGMRFYSLGELLRLTPAPMPDYNAPLLTQDEGAGVGATEEDREMYNNVRHVVNAADGTDNSPWLMAATALHAAQRVLPTPALLIRCRLLDPSPTALPPTHALLLGSVTLLDFPPLLHWLQSLTQECGVALHRLQPDSWQPVSRVDVGDTPSALSSRAASSVPHQEHLENESAMLAQLPCAPATTLVGTGSRDASAVHRGAAKRPRQAMERQLPAHTLTMAEVRGPSPLSALCAALSRLLSFIAEVTTWVDFWAPCTADQHTRAQCRFFLGELRDVHRTLVDLACTCAISEGCRSDNEDRGFLASSRQRVEPRRDSSPSEPTWAKQAQSEGKDDVEAIITVREVERLVRLSAVVCVNLKKLLPEPKTTL